MNTPRLQRLARLASLLLAAIAFTGITQASDADTLKLPQTVEVDLLYPRNGSICGPNDEFPVVAAIQNSKASHLLYPNLYYTFGTGTYSANATYPFTQTLCFQGGFNDTVDTDVFLWHGYGNITAGDWFLVFIVDADICYPDPAGSGRSFFHGIDSTSVVYFTVRDL
ncbi:hypothetical protein NLG97_g4367 [Lecanicillium saksenae]|uniref:Uncharacterized protein n=1 Tax=Lecanicillium saksenae TaxID=468837 RepID=A0ACC1QX65_9HYPO|nr:hypothetical protein NLG97_g4367 [Lecanicillium saksenae]